MLSLPQAWISSFAAAKRPDKKVSVKTGFACKVYVCISASTKQYHDVTSVNSLTAALSLSVKPVTASLSD